MREIDEAAYLVHQAMILREKGQLQDALRTLQVGGRARQSRDIVVCMDSYFSNSAGIRVVATWCPSPPQMLSSGCSGMREEIYLKGLSMLVDTYCQMREYTKVRVYVLMCLYDSSMRVFSLPSPTPLEMPPRFRLRCSAAR